MTKFIGDVSVFLEALGREQGNDSILDAISIIATDFDIEYFDFENIKSTYFHFFKRGVDFVFLNKDSNEILESIFFYVGKFEGYNEYPFLNELFCDLNDPISKDSIMNVFGTPESISASWIRYVVNGKYIHFEFDDSQKLNLITLFVNI
ncbi:hypothetical protein BKG92_10350 [Rodentibacter ratti]|uniref:Uncharacterized protein n=1 Tax=Rodentibacter ratti TaxID=1906745 RepID=A0A1V3KTX3_9PAST|nr:hypothetical protein [Rodentibacter ratti]OOF80758.1 hypothetical protein BKG92_10350 [Rodentibacter ratti]